MQRYLSQLLFRWPWMTLSCPVRVCTVPWPSGRSTWGLLTSASHGQPPSTCVKSRERVSNLRIRRSQVRREDEAPHGGEEWVAGCFLYHCVSQILHLYVTSIQQSSYLPLRTGKTPLISKTFQRIWDMLLVWRMVSSMFTTTLLLLTNISPRTCPALTTIPSSTTWTSSLPLLHRAQRESLKRNQLHSEILELQYL